MTPADDDAERPTRRLEALRLLRQRGGRASEAGPGAPETAAPPAAARPRAGRKGFDLKTLARRNWRQLTAAGLLLLGVLFVMLGWYGAAHTNIITEQIPYLISGGLLGLGLIIVAGFVASFSVLEQENRELRREIARALAAARVGEAVPAGAAPSLIPGPPSGNGHVFVVPGGRTYHEPGCPLVEGKDGVQELEPAQAAGSGYTACKLCGPD